MLPSGEYSITSMLHPENVLDTIGNTVYALKDSLTTWDVKLNKQTGDYTIVQHGNHLNGYLDYVLNTTRVMIHKPHVPAAGKNQRWTITDAGQQGYVFLAAHSRYQCDAYNLIGSPSKVLRTRMQTLLLPFPRPLSSVSTPFQTTVFRRTDGSSL